MLAECRLISVVLLYLSSALAENEKPKRQQTEDYIPCEKGWILFKEKCYRLGGQNAFGGLSWMRASDICADSGGTMATVDNKELNDFLVTFLLLDAKVSAWIGLHDRANEKVYVWQDGTPLKYQNWDPSQPSDSKPEDADCVEMVFVASQDHNLNTTGEWNELNCDSDRAYICQTETSKQGKKTPDPRFCSGSEGAWKYQDSCYSVVMEKLSWQNAEQYCQDKFQGHLVTIADFTVELFLDHILKKYNKEMWIGIKIKEQLQQKWSSGWHVAYSDWDKDKGDNVDGTCVLRSKTKLWTTTPCSKKYSFVCERSDVIPPVLTQSSKGSQCPELPEDWHDLDGDYCYFFETTRKVNWYLASFECMARGGSLASIHSTAESVTLQPFVKYTQDRIFIGLYRLAAHDDVFVWADGSHLDFKNWDVVEPNDVNELCGELWSRHMRWNDVLCKEEKGYICSVKKVSPNVTEINVPVECSGDVPLNALIGVSVCVLLVVILLAVVVYCLRPCGRVERRKGLKSNRPHVVPIGERPRYRSSEIVVKEDDGGYENMP